MGRKQASWTTRCWVKPYSRGGKTELVGYFWSGPHDKAIKGINLVTLFYGEAGGMRVPVNFRVVDKAAGKTRNDLFREMVAEWLLPRAEYPRGL